MPDRHAQLRRLSIQLGTLRDSLFAAGTRGADEPPLTPAAARSIDASVRKLELGLEHLLLAIDATPPDFQARRSVFTGPEAEGVIETLEAAEAAAFRDDVRRIEEL